MQTIMSVDVKGCENIRGNYIKRKDFYLVAGNILKRLLEV